ncbi:MAG: ankyrin repeat domain-containing protein [Verrucomicrobia bacterium]|nr:ankyrin repeat domain-containing protein [Verrucomicrobiota bacterium]
MKTIRQTLLLLLAGILGTVVAVFALKTVRTVLMYRHGGGGNACVHYQRLPILDEAEAKPILDRAIQRIHQRLIQAGDHLPALSEISEADIAGFCLAYRKGNAFGSRTGKRVFEPPDSCRLSLQAEYPFGESPMSSMAPTKKYSVEGEGFAYGAELEVASDKDEIHGIIEQEMDRAAGELQKAARSKALKAGEEIHIAVRVGDVARVEQLLAAKPEFANARDSRGYTPLHWARDPGVAERLLAKSPDVNAADTLGLTPLHWAVYEDRFEVVKMLVAHEADINRKASGGWTPMSLAEELCGEGGRITRFLLQHGGVSEIPDAKLSYVIKHPTTPDLKRVFQRRPDVVTWKDEHGCTALHYAVGSRNIQIVEFLLAAGAGVNVRDNSGRAPLLYAAASRDVKVVELLLARKADVNVRNEMGETPLDLAERVGPPEVVDLLRECGAISGAGAIHDAVGRGDMARVKELLSSQPALVNEKDSSGWSPVHQTLNRNQQEMLRLLLDHKADVNARTPQGETALHFAITRGGSGYNSKSKEARDAGIKETIALLLAHGADINARDNQGDTPLHRAAGRINKDLVELLLANKADVNAKDKNGRTPLDRAAAAAGYNPKGYPVSVLLREHGGTLTKALEDVRPPWKPVGAPMPITHNGVPITRSQLMELMELPDIKAAREALAEAPKKYNAVMNALMARLGYQTVYHTNSMRDGTTRIDRQLLTADGVPLTYKQKLDLQNMPELKPIREAVSEAVKKHREAMNAAMARLGYQIGSGTNRAPSAIQRPPAASGTNGVVQVKGVDGQQPSGKR